MKRPTFQCIRIPPYTIKLESFAYVCGKIWASPSTLWVSCAGIRHGEFTMWPSTPPRRCKWKGWIKGSAEEVAKEVYTTTSGFVSREWEMLNWVQEIPAHVLTYFESRSIMLKPLLGLGIRIWMVPGLESFAKWKLWACWSLQNRFGFLWNVFGMNQQILSCLRVVLIRI